MVNNQILKLKDTPQFYVDVKELGPLGQLVKLIKFRMLISLLSFTSSQTGL